MFVLLLLTTPISRTLSRLLCVDRQNAGGHCKIRRRLRDATTRCSPTNVVLAPLIGKCVLERTVVVRTKTGRRSAVILDLTARAAIPISPAGERESKSRGEHRAGGRGPDERF